MSEEEFCKIAKDLESLSRDTAATLHFPVRLESESFLLENETETGSVRRMENVHRRISLPQQILSDVLM